MLMLPTGTARSLLGVDGGLVGARGACATGCLTVRTGGGDESCLHSVGAPGLTPGTDSGWTSGMGWIPVELELSLASVSLVAWLDTSFCLGVEDWRVGASVYMTDSCMTRPSGGDWACCCAVRASQETGKLAGRCSVWK